VKSKTTHHAGDLIVKSGKDYSHIEQIGGYLYCSGADTKAAFPKLTSVGGSIDCRGADTKAAFPKLTSVGGYLYCSGADTKAAFPKLTSVGGSIDCRGADTKAAFPKLTSVGGSIYCRGADTKAAFPKLTSVGGSIDCRGANTKFPNVKTKDPNCPAINLSTRALIASFAAAGFFFADGILSKIISHKKQGSVTVYSVALCGQTKKSFVVDKNGIYSHGETIKEAKAEVAETDAAGIVPEFPRTSKVAKGEVVLIPTLPVPAGIKAKC